MSRCASLFLLLTAFGYRNRRVPPAGYPEPMSIFMRLARTNEL